MKLKHLQLNTSTLKDPASIMRFINDNQIDISCLQEVCYQTGGENPLFKLISKDYFYSEGISFYYEQKNLTVAEAILSKFEILDDTRFIINSPNYLPKTIQKHEELSSTIFNDSQQTTFPGSRGITHSIKSRCILSNLLKTPSGIIRVITTHFNVSDLCTETTQMYEIAEFIYSLIKNSKDYPTILSGDLNIRAKSYSINKIKEVLKCHTEELKDTLSIKHISKKDFPEGLAIDHVFSKNLKHISTNAEEITFSEHKAIITEFEI